MINLLKLKNPKNIKKQVEIKNTPASLIKKFHFSFIESAGLLLITLAKTKLQTKRLAP